MALIILPSCPLSSLVRLGGMPSIHAYLSLTTSLLPQTQSHLRLGLTLQRTSLSHPEVDLRRGRASSRGPGEKIESMPEVSAFSRGGEEKEPQRAKSLAAGSPVIGT